MDKKIFYIVILIIAAGIAAFLMSRPVSPVQTSQITVIGTWQSVDNSKFLREFQSDGTMIDVYDNQIIDEAVWSPFTKNNPVATEYPLEPGAIYIQTTGKNGIQQMKIVSVASSSLELLYLGQTKTVKFIRLRL